ncbi:MarC family protein [Polynucleobacter sp. AP-Latsch-80-C2]|jgi:multiple antibiotic resistance protein|uniref:MarC family protein n=1 Tax=Polynucleobacter sp. AP-Latsch-80-C2 TaxID=2576931 RepID=UPI001C0E7646|nr:MarC family protein [Polynucleobacter sp. AP-Latsch-80-C2]MBU3624290.1 MarC family protein [Polynucleobacter sp. AP-Latsch-80-C2]
MFATAFASFVAVFAALFPVINPLGDGPIFLNMVQGCSLEVRNKLARSVSINAFFLLFVSMLIGPQILLFFGISLPALKLAGGAVVIGMGWSLLNQKTSSSKDSGDSAGITDANANNAVFFPLTMPLTTGPGSIATAIALVAAYQDGKPLNLLHELPAVMGTIAALLTLSVVIYVVYRESSGIQKLLGPAGTNALMRLFAFILLAIGVQIFLGGINGFALELSKLIPAH